MERDPSGTFCYLGSGPTDGRRHGSTPGFGFDFGFEWETTSDQIDSAMPEKTHTEAPPYGLRLLGNRSGAQGIVVNAPLTKESPGLPAGRAEHFPV